MQSWEYHGDEPRVVLTGGTGRVGRAVASRLRSLGIGFKALGHANCSDLSCAVDILDEVALVDAFAGCNTVIHCAGTFGGSDQLVWDVNVVGTRNVVTAAEACGVSHLVAMGSAVVTSSGRRVDTYAQAKKIAEDLVLTADIDGTVVRSGWVIADDAETLDRFTPKRDCFVVADHFPIATIGVADLSTLVVGTVTDKILGVVWAVTDQPLQEDIANYASSFYNGSRVIVLSQDRYQRITGRYGVRHLPTNVPMTEISYTRARLGHYVSWRQSVREAVTRHLVMPKG